MRLGPGRSQEIHRIAEYCPLGTLIALFDRTPPPPVSAHSVAALDDVDDDTVEDVKEIPEDLAAENTDRDSTNDTAIAFWPIAW